MLFGSASLIWEKHGKQFIAEWHQNGHYKSEKKQAKIRKTKMGNLLKFIAFFLFFIGQVANITVEAGKKYKKAKRAPEPEVEMEQEYENENENGNMAPQNDCKIIKIRT